MIAVCQLSGFPKEYLPTDFARIMLISRMILSMIKVRTVSLSEMAAGFAGKAETDSDERRMRRFLGDFLPDSDFIAFFIASELPEGRWIITADRNGMGVWKREDRSHCSGSRVRRKSVVSGAEKNDMNIVIRIRENQQAGNSG